MNLACIIEKENSSSHVTFPIDKYNAYNFMQYVILVTFLGFHHSLASEPLTVVIPAVIEFPKLYEMYTAVAQYEGVCFLASSKSIFP